MPHYTNWFASMTGLTVVAGAAISLSYIGDDAHTSLSTAESTLGTTLATASSTFNTSTDSLGADSAASTALLSQTNNVVFDLQLGSQSLNPPDYFTADASVASFTFAPGGQWTTTTYYQVATESSEGTADVFGIDFRAPDPWAGTPERMIVYQDPEPSLTLKALADDVNSLLYTVPAEAHLTLNGGATITENIDITVQYIGRDDVPEYVVDALGYNTSNTIKIPTSGPNVELNLNHYVVDPDGGNLSWAFSEFREWSSSNGPNGGWGLPVQSLPNGYSFSDPTLTIEPGAVGSGYDKASFIATEEDSSTTIHNFYFEEE